MPCKMIAEMPSYYRRDICNSQTQLSLVNQVVNMNYDGVVPETSRVKTEQLIICIGIIGIC